MTTENDIVLIYFEDKPMTFARIEEIQADHKPDWYHVKLLMLQVPIQVVTWILRTAYISGSEFTMNGNRMRLEQVTCPEDPETAIPDEDIVDDTPKTGEKGKKVISFSDLKKH
ncbi:hypothetical protein [Desulfococcus sp.]|uniref:hypothetical protein n=1 Tax=Desulfococcus sp. TaxID=2025834 RepID=UPI003593A910